MPGDMILAEKTNEDPRLNEARCTDVNSVVPGMRLAPMQTQLHQNSPCKFPEIPIQTLCPLETLDSSRVCLLRVWGSESLISTLCPTAQSMASVAIKPNWLRLFWTQQLSKTQPGTSWGTTAFGVLYKQQWRPGLLKLTNVLSNCVMLWSSLTVLRRKNVWSREIRSLFLFVSQGNLCGRTW